VRKNILLNFISFFLVLGVLLVVGIYFYNWMQTSSTTSLSCKTDVDCVVFGKTGTCNCGCYNQNNLPTPIPGECFCEAPTTCLCQNSQCIGVYEQEISDYESESTFCNGMSLDEAKSIARKGECGWNFKDTYSCNETTKTWWIDLDIDKPTCNPACVVNTDTKESEINWRCRGLISQ